MAGGGGRESRGMKELLFQGCDRQGLEIRVVKGEAAVSRSISLIPRFCFSFFA